MSRSRLPQNIMSLERFVLRAEVLKLYRQMMRIVQQIPDKSQRQELRKFIREDFELNKNLQDEELIRMHLSRGKTSLKELESTVTLVK